MPTRPTVSAQTKVASSVGMLRAIFNDPNNDLLYKQIKVDDTVESIRAAGQYITSFVPRANQAINALVNLIGMQRLQYLIWNNPWSWAKQGKLEMGETVEQIWIDLAKAYTFDADASESRFLKREKPDVKVAFHRVNYCKFYKITIEMQKLKNAFLSREGLANFVEDLIQRTSQTATVDEFYMMKYVIALTMLDGHIKTVPIPAITADTADDVITDVTTVTNNFQFPLPGKEYNIAGVMNTCSPANTMILETTDANALIKVNALAQAFNIDEVKFVGNVTMHDGLGNYDWNRMDDLLKDDPGYRRFTEDEISQLNNVKLLAMDRQFMQIYDNYEYMGEPLRNGEGLFENYFYHVGRVLSTSPFHNAVAFVVAEDSNVVSITLSPEEATASPGQSVVLQASVETTGFASADVAWTCEGGGTTTYIDKGVLHIGDATSGSTITVTAISTADTSISGTATITVA